jgi:hypothetical protein
VVRQARHGRAWEVGIFDDDQWREKVTVPPCNGERAGGRWVGYFIRAIN